MLDMAKAYDRLEYKFRENTIKSMVFPINMVTTIMKCVNTVSFSIEINGNYSIRFYPSIDIRQGYMLSLNLFILYADLLSGLLIDGQVRGTIKCLL